MILRRGYRGGLRFCGLAGWEWVEVSFEESAESLFFDIRNGGDNHISGFEVSLIEAFDIFPFYGF